jgi:hypothetical protein
VTLLADTQTVSIPASPDGVFAFLAEPENLPRWAVGFAHGVRRDGDGWTVQTAHGAVPVRVAADPGRGTVDVRLGIAPGTEAVAYSRLLPSGDGTEYVFTQFQQPGMGDDVFAGQRAALAEELALLPILFRARAACPVGR